MDGVSAGAAAQTVTKVINNAYRITISPVNRINLIRQFRLAGYHNGHLKSLGIANARGSEKGH
jgi:hypothetical protein